MKNKNKTIKICSACLLGIKCTNNGKDKRNKKIIKLAKKELLIPVCPEILGGLSTPRKPVGIYRGFGKDVLQGRATVRMAREGKDVTKYFLKGAKETLKIAKLLGAKEALLKINSPSCGCGRIWQLDKDLRNHMVKGDGVTAALLKKNGIRVISERDL